jgi:hypothetical protein
MRLLSSVLFLATLIPPAPAQACGGLVPSGQPVLAAIRPACRNLVAPAVLWAAGNPAFQFHAPLVHAAVPLGRPMFLLIGTPVPPPIPIGPPILDPALGLPGLLAMNRILFVLPASVSGTLGVPPVPFPLPATGGPLGLVLSAQILVSMPGGTFGLSGATGITV